MTWLVADVFVVSTLSMLCKHYWIPSTGRSNIKNAVLWLSRAVRQNSGDAVDTEDVSDLFVPTAADRELIHGESAGGISDITEFNASLYFFSSLRLAMATREFFPEKYAILSFKTIWPTRKYGTYSGHPVAQWMESVYKSRSQRKGWSSSLYHLLLLSYFSLPIMLQDVVVDLGCWCTFVLVLMGHIELYNAQRWLAAAPVAFIVAIFALRALFWSFRRESSRSLSRSSSVTTGEDSSSAAESESVTNSDVAETLAAKPTLELANHDKEILFSDDGNSVVSILSRAASQDSIDQIPVERILTTSVGSIYTDGRQGHSAAVAPCSENDKYENADLISKAKATVLPPIRLGSRSRRTRDRGVGPGHSQQALANSASVSAAPDIVASDSSTAGVGSSDPPIRVIRPRSTAGGRKANLKTVRLPGPGEKNKDSSPIAEIRNISDPISEDDFDYLRRFDAGLEKSKTSPAARNSDKSSGLDVVASRWDQVEQIRARLEQNDHNNISQTDDLGDLGEGSLDIFAQSHFPFNYGSRK